MVLTGLVLELEQGHGNWEGGGLAVVPPPARLAFYAVTFIAPGFLLNTSLSTATRRLRVIRPS